MTDQSKGLLITFLGVLFVVPDALFVRLIDADALVIAFWRGLISGCVILLGVLIYQGPHPVKAVFKTGRFGFIYIFSLGCSGTMFVLAVSMTSVANVVFIIASLPVFAALYSRIFLKEPIRPRMIATMAAVAVGLAIIGYGSGETKGAHWSGDLMALGVSAIFAAGLTAARRVKQVSMVPAVPVAYIGASLILLLIINPFSVPNGQWGLVAFHGSFIVVSASLLALGPRYITSAEVGLLILLESVLAPLLAWALLDENPGIWALSGGAVVVVALAISNTIALARQR